MLVYFEDKILKLKKNAKDEFIAGNKNQLTPISVAALMEWSTLSSKTLDESVGLCVDKNFLSTTFL